MVQQRCSISSSRSPLVWRWCWPDTHAVIHAIARRRQLQLIVYPKARAWWRNVKKHRPPSAVTGGVGHAVVGQMVSDASPRGRTRKVPWSPLSVRSAWGRAEGKKFVRSAAAAGLPSGQPDSPSLQGEAKRPKLMWASRSIPRSAFWTGLQVWRRTWKPLARLGRWIAMPYSILVCRRVILAAVSGHRLRGPRIVLVVQRSLMFRLFYWVLSRTVRKCRRNTFFPTQYSTLFNLKIAMVGVRLRDFSL